MSKIERTKQRIEKLNVKAKQAQEKLNNAKSLLDKAQTKEIKSLVFYIGNAFINALRKGEIDPDYLINLCRLHGDKRKNYDQLIKSTGDKKTSEIPAPQ